jgi:hypothetical protein
MVDTVLLLHPDGKSRRVRLAFCWLGFLIPTLWSLSEGLWRPCAFSLLGAVATHLTFNAAKVVGVPLFSFLGFLIYPAVMLAFGFRGNRWLLSHLLVKGWVPNPPSQPTT